jgi:hypothetical protein
MDIVVMSGIILGLTQLVKITVGVTPRYIPITALFVSGIVFGLFAYTSSIVVDWKLVESAFVVALTSIGLWSGTKSTLVK